jgi:hypothetical protein
MKRRWGTIILHGAVAGLEICWFWAFLDLVNQKTANGSLPLLLFLGFYPLSFVSYRILRRLPLKKAIPLGCLAWAATLLFLAKVLFFSHTAWGDPLWLRDFGGAIARMVHSSNPEALLTVSSAVFWGFGCRLAYGRIHFATLVSEFQFGLAILLALFLLNAQWELSPATLIPLTLAFFFFALGGIGVSHGLERESWVSGRYRGRWFAFLLLTIGFILGMGWLISAVVNPSLIEFILSFLAGVGRWIWSWIVKFFIFLGELIPPPKPAQLGPAARLAQTKGLTDKPFLLFSDSVREVIRFLWGAMVVSLLLVALWRISSDIFEWLRRKMGGMADAEVETLPGAFREDFFNFLKRLLRIFGVPWPFRRGRRAEPFLAGADRVRKTYRQLSAWAAKKGHARDPAQTPYEFLQGLTLWLPEKRGDLACITEQYVRVRYGLSATTESGLEELRESWQRIRQTRFKKGLKKK